MVFGWFFLFSNEGIVQQRFGGNEDKEEQPYEEEPVYEDSAYEEPASEETPYEEQPIVKGKPPEPLTRRPVHFTETPMAERVEAPRPEPLRKPARPKTTAELDSELQELLAKQRATIKVIGCGGGGNNTIDRIREVGVEGAETIAINTEAQDLLFTNADKKILIGRDITKGLGAGSNPKIGEEAAKEQEHEIKQAVQGADMVFITCGLGGGTGSGSAPVVADIAKRMGALAVAIVTMPFTMEGNRRYQNAVDALDKLQHLCDTLIVIPNDKLLELAPDLPIHTAFKVADEILTNAVKGIAEMVTKAGLVNLDFADIRAVMGNGGVALIGVGESDSEKRAVEAVEKAINNPLLDADISGATGALINISGGPDLTLEEARKIVETVSQRMSDQATIIWGAQIYEDMTNTVRAMLIITGVHSPQIMGRARMVSPKKIIAGKMQDDLGIDFVD